MKKHIPNLLSLLNLASGFVAIVLLLNGEVIIATFVLIAALVFDFLDGQAARILKAESALGLQLDSLADLVSFGVAPGLMMYYLILDGSGAESIKNILIWLPVVIPVLSGLRLAIFNIDESQTESFKGLPTPANAIFIMGLILTREYSDSLIIENLYSSRWVLAFFTLCFSVLMVTRIPMFSLKVKQLRFKGNELRFIFILLCILLAAGTGIDSIPLIIILYISVSLSHGFIR
jgi:CDP-diacylglycerol--serine O-phosphatidyltransferase